VLPLVGVNVLPRLVASLSQQGVLPRLLVREHTVSGLLDMLGRGELDCVVGRLEGSHTERSQERLSITPLWDEHLAIACAPHHPLVKRRDVSLSALRDSPWILPPRGTHTREIFEQPFLDGGHLPPVPHIESISFHSSLSMVAASDFLAVAPDSAVRHYAAMSMVHKVRLRTSFGTGRMVFITHLDMETSVAVALIAKALQEQTLEP
jgi:DNA-binding transcriptional LysR family regulator